MFQTYIYRVHFLLPGPSKRLNLFSSSEMFDPLEAGIQYSKCLNEKTSNDFLIALSRAKPDFRGSTISIKAITYHKK